MFNLNVLCVLSIIIVVILDGMTLTTDVSVLRLSRIDFAMMRIWNENIVLKGWLSLLVVGTLS